MLKLEDQEKSPSSSQDCEDLCENLNKLDLNTKSPDTESSLSFTTLPLEILYRIFESCHLSDQLILAKVCKLFRQIIRDILQRKSKFFNYNYITFKYKQQLQDYEISELCYLCGRAVERARFSTFFNMDLLKHIEWSGVRTNPLENLKYFINNNFKQNVKYFKNLLELEVQGKFLQDQAILEMAKNCKKLKTLKLLDGDNRWLWGEHLQDLESIENLELKSCRNLDPNHMLAVSQKRQLKSLNIVECEHLQDIPKMLKLCDHWQYLESLRLTAFSQDRNLLNAIINLPALKTLQFFWINFMPLDFEENFFLELSSNTKKSLSLKHLKFENDRYYIEDESLQKWTPEKYAAMRENVCINGQSWQWSAEIFDKISKNFEYFKNLQTVTLFYCRLLDYEQIKHLSLINEQLELIKIYGCPQEKDEQFKKLWQEEGVSARCRVDFESCLTLKEVMDLNREAISRQYSSFYRREPVLRSIECQFS
ncbi:uncharacterized protein ACRADG_004708 isoform 1-T2 [Cochliomyia hominivorax]